MGYKLSTNTMAWTIQNGGPDERELRAVVRRVVEAAEPDMVILFGSAARRQMRKDSDIDLLVVKEVDDVRELKSSARRALLREDRSVDVLGANRQMLAERETAALGVFEEAINDGVIVYETGNAEAQCRASVDERLAAERLSADEKMRKLRMSREALATKMLERAGMDIRSLNARTKDQAPETMAMVAEQGEEKTIKAMLIAHGVRRIEGHHIHKIAEQLERHGEVLPEGIDKQDLEMLAETNMGGRFPEYDWEDYEPDYDKFFNIANRIHEWGRKRVPEIIQAPDRGDERTPGETSQADMMPPVRGE